MCICCSEFIKGGLSSGTLFSLEWDSVSYSCISFSILERFLEEESWSEESPDRYQSYRIILSLFVVMV